MADPQGVLDALAACFCAQFPDDVLCCVTAGDPTLISCCPGQAWVRVVNISPDGPTTSYAPCGPVMWIMEMELGIYRCAPTECGGPLDPLCCDAEAESAAQLLLDRAAMLRAISCCPELKEFRRSVTYGSFQIEGPTGGCIAATIRVFLRITDDCSC